MKIAVVDDEQMIRDTLIEMLQKYAAVRHTPVESCAFENGEKLLGSLETETFDLIIMDVFLGQESGMELARALRARGVTSRLVFATMSTQYAVESYEVEAFYYLLKPVREEALFKILDKCSAALYDQKQYIQLKVGWDYKQVLLSEIQYVDIYNHYVQIHTESGVVSCHMTFREISETLLKYPRFLCCYRNCVVNMDRVQHIDGRDFLLDSGVRIPIARANLTAVRKQYADYLLFKLNEGN